MTLDNWLRDMPQQFQEKKNIEILVKAFSRQIDEVYQMFDDLKYATTLENAKGQNLKYIGDILSTSLKEAQSILMAANNEEITDETYRKVLQYKALQNNCDCTYYDIMESINLLWDASNVKYVEDPSRPATIYIALKDASIDGIDPAVGRVLAIKPAGVAMIYAAGYLIIANISGIEKANVPRIVIKLPPIENEEALISRICMAMKTNIEETVTASVVMKKNLWMLDGTYLLDGTKTLDAERGEEVL